MTITTQNSTQHIGWVRDNIFTNLVGRL